MARGFECVDPKTIDLGVLWSLSGSEGESDSDEWVDSFNRVSRGQSDKTLGKRRKE